MRAKDRRVRHRLGHDGQWLPVEGEHRLGYRPNSEREVGTGIAVWYGKDVDTIEFLFAASHPVGGRQQREAQATAVQVPDAGNRGAQVSLTTDTATSGRTSLWSLMGTR